MYPIDVYIQSEDLLIYSVDVLIYSVNLLIYSIDFHSVDLPIYSIDLFIILWICTCCHTEIEVADQTFYLTQSQYTDTGPTSPSADPVTPGDWQGSQWSANF